MQRNKVAIGCLAAFLGAGVLVYGGYRGLTGAVGWFLARSAEFEALSKSTLTDLAANGWSVATLRKYASPAYATKLNESPDNAELDAVRRLGAFRQFVGSTLFNEHTTPVATTVAIGRDMTFENGKATLQLDYVWADDRWQLTGIHVKL